MKKVNFIPLPVLWIDRKNSQTVQAEPAIHSPLVPQPRRTDFPAHHDARWNVCWSFLTQVWLFIFPGLPKGDFGRSNADRSANQERRKYIWKKTSTPRADHCAIVGYRLSRYRRCSFSGSVRVTNSYPNAIFEVALPIWYIWIASRLRMKTLDLSAYQG